MGQPPRYPGDSDEYGQHDGRDAHGLKDHVRVEVHIRVELPGNEIVVREGNFFQLEGDVEQRVLAGDAEHVVSGLLDDGGPGVVILVNPVSEALQLALPGLDVVDEGLDV